jgi:hypothetical protein
MSFRNVDGSSEMLESGSAQLYSRILVANKSKRQTRVDWQYGIEFPIFLQLLHFIESGPNLSNLLAILVLAFTSISVVTLGIFSTYGTVLMILNAVSYSSSPSLARPFQLVTSETQAGGD